MISFDKLLVLTTIASLAAGSATAQPTDAHHTHRHHRARVERATFYIAPGNPATVGEEGSVTGVVPGRAVRAPRGAMGSLGGIFGTTWVHGDPNGATPAAVTASKASMKTSAAPVRGANSFTMGEARRRLTRNGFTEVTGLQKDRDGVWRGKAMREGVPVSVFCDYQGNVGAS